jgi:hypothetical protein
MEPWRAVDAHNGGEEAQNGAMGPWTITMEARRVKMDPWRAVDAHNGGEEAQNGAMEGRGRSQWRRGGSKWSREGL